MASQPLKGCQGVFQTDGYGGSNHWVKMPGIIHAGDLDQVHPRFLVMRKFAGKTRKEKGDAHRALELIQILNTKGRCLGRVVVEMVEEQVIVVARQVRKPTPVLPLNVWAVNQCRAGIR